MLGSFCLLVCVGAVSTWWLGFGACVSSSCLCACVVSYSLKKKKEGLGFIEKGKDSS